MEPTRRMERSYKSWIISLLAVILVLAVISVSLLTLLVLQGREGHSQDFHSRKTRDVDQHLDVVEEAETGVKKGLDDDLTCVLNAHDEDKTNDEPVCITQDCTGTASTLIASMDRSVDPCKNFYKFACGGFIRKNPVPSDAQFTSTSLSNLKYYMLLLKSLLEDTDSSKEPNVVFRMQEAYHVCINTTYNSQKEIQGFKKILHDDLYDWPYAGDYLEANNLTLEEFMGILVHKGFKVPFLTAGVDTNIFDDSRMFLPSVAGHQEDPPVDIDAIKATPCEDGVGGHLESLAHFIKPNDTHVCYRNPSQMAALNLGAIILNRRASGEERKLTVAELDKSTHHKFNWLAFLNKAYEGVHTFKDSDEIYIQGDYLESVAEMISEQDKSTFAHYVLDVIVQEAAKHGGPEIQKYFLDLMNALSPGFKLERETFCLNWIMEMYPMPMTRLVVKTYLHPSTKEKATKMIDLIVKSYENNIINSEWVDDATEKEAIAKAKAIRKQIAYPEFVMKDDEIEKMHSHMGPVYSTHIENYISLSKAHGLEKFHFLVEEFRPESDWLATPLTINAGYSPDMNTVVMQLGMLTPPFFDPSRVAAVNYGMVGSVIGHEIGHGFDTSGRLYNHKGKKVQWWTEQTEAKYLNLTNCFIDQYSKFCPEELVDVCVDGHQTVGENVADNTGLRAAFEAYRALVTELGEEKRLPGLQEYTPEQIFFISFGYAWCENLPPHFFKERYGDDEHSPGQFRVLGALANSREFAEVFHCPLGPMNRGKESCTLW